MSFEVIQKASDIKDNG